MLKKIMKIIAIVFVVILVLAGGFLAWLTITEYSPDSVEPAYTLAYGGNGNIEDGAVLRFISFNTGYAALGEESEFFMDGGSQVRPDSISVIEKNCAGILSILERADADFYLLQEVDTDSKRSYGVDQAGEYASALDMNSAYALNHSCRFVPYPIPPIGKVNAGVQTLCNYGFISAERISLPSPFSWPVSTANLKRCLLVTRFDIEGSDSELVVVNLHLEAYDDGEGKLEQTNALMDILTEEYAKGNYVVAGGDFNQSFPGCLENFPIIDQNNWTPGLLSEEMLPEGWRYAYDSSVASSRLLDAPLSPDTQLYVIDGFILSPNIELLSVATLDEGFEFSDHNPVEMEIRLK